MLGRRFRNIGISFCSAGALFAGPLALGQTADSDAKQQIENVRRLDEIAAQKIEAEVHSAYKEADRLSVSDRAAAMERLKTVLARVETETSLDTERREKLARMLKVKIRFLEVNGSRPPVSTIGPALAQQRRAEQDRREADDAAIRRAMEAIHTLQADGKFNEARAAADDLARRYPTHPAVVAGSRTAGIAENVARLQAHAIERNRGEVSALRDLHQTATPPSRDVDFPKDWTEKVKNRTRGTPLTDKEKSILKSLEAPIAVRFRGEPFDNVIKTISDLMKQPILIDRIALEEALIKYETPVTLETPANGMAARTVLRRLLGDYGLAYVIKDQTIEVTSALKAKSMMVVRSYFVGDLLNNPSLAAAMGQPQLAMAGPGVPWWTNPMMNQNLYLQQVNLIIDMIKDSVEPDSWRTGGASITFSAATMSLVIRQSTEVHGILSGGVLR